MNGIIRTINVVVLLAAASVQCSKIHERMSNDEMSNFFRTTSDKNLEYEVAPVRHNLRKRSDQNLRMQFTAFGKKIDAYFHPSNGALMDANTPVWLAFTKPDGTVEYKKMREGIVGMVVSRFFASPTDFSSVVVMQAEGENPTFNGIVSGLLVRPLPNRFREDARFRRNGEASNASGTVFDTDYHVIIRSKSTAEEARMRRVERQIREVSRFCNQTDAGGAKRPEKAVVHPTLLIQTDFEVSETKRDDLDYSEEIIYQIAFWNAVDLRFRHVNDPEIRLRVARLIIGRDRTAAPFLHNHRIGNAIHLKRKMNDDLYHWVAVAGREEFPPTGYHIVVTMTDDIYYGDRPVGGLGSFLSCQGPWNSRVLIRDRGGFDGILMAAHEIGHVLRLDHEQASGDECDSSNGLIMAPIWIPAPKDLEWSPCSSKNISKFLRSPFASCDDERSEFSTPGNPVERLLPGDVWGPHRQCQGRGYAMACDSTPDMCTQLQCYYTHWQGLITAWQCQNSGPAAEGTLCAPGRKCVDGACQCMTEDCIFINGTAGP